MTKAIERGKISPKEWKRIVRLYKQAQQKAEQAEQEQKEPDRPPIAWSYRRCSHEESAASGLGLEVQEQTIERYYPLLQVKYPGVERGQMFSDEAVSAYRRRLITRPAGADLNRALRRGDHVVFARLDRGFRNLRDMLTTLEDWEARGITVHFVSEGLDLSTANGRLILHILGSVAEWQSSFTSERNREVIRRLRQTGRWAASHLPMGLKAIGPKGSRRIVHDIEKRQWMALIVKLKDEQKWTFRQISNYCEVVLARREHRQPLPEFHMGKRKWSLGRCWKAYQGEKRLREIIAEARAHGHKCLKVGDLEISLADLLGIPVEEVPSAPPESPTGEWPDTLS